MKYIPCETTCLRILHLLPGLIDASPYETGSMDEVEIDILKS